MPVTPDLFVNGFIIAILLPILIGFLKQAKFPDIYNALIAVAVYVVAGVGAILLSGQPFDPKDITVWVSLFVGFGTIAYQAFWKQFEATAIAARLNLGAGPTP